MFLKEMVLHDFRNYRERGFDFSKRVTVFVGPNAVGKTNLLEAVCLLAIGESFRAGKIEEMVRWECEVSHVSGKVNDRREEANAREVQLQSTLTRGMVNGERVRKRKFLVNGVVRRKKDFVGNLVVVVFMPEHLGLIGGSPSRRRAYLDMVLSQVDREYWRSLVAYEKALRRRNKLLDLIREGEVGRETLAFWDQVLIKNGSALTGKRRELIEFMNSFADDGEMGEEFERLKFVYDFSPISEQRLLQYKREEVAAGYTLVGPHKDDFRVLAESERGVGEERLRDLAVYGSRGQQRLAVLWLKLAELAFTQHKLKQTPILLLDDILSELDEEHKKLVLSSLGKQQTVITATDASMFKRISGVKMVELKA